jgi:hypothetical protein
MSDNNVVVLPSGRTLAYKVEGGRRRAVITGRRAWKIKAPRLPHHVAAKDMYPRCVDCRRPVDSFSQKSGEIAIEQQRMCEPDWCRWCARPLSVSAMEACDRASMQRQADLLEACGFVWGGDADV